jgi:sugar/nucleoside kinase (ribokinase family)
LGKEGSILRTGEATRRFPIFKVSPVDVSGSGNAFMAGLLYGMLEGWPLDRAVLFASATSAFCIRAVGCTGGIRPADEILEFMNQQIADGLVDVTGLSM